MRALSWFPVLALALGLGACAAPPRAMSRPPGVAISRDLEYRRFDTTSLHIDLYRPSGVAGPLPAILWVHGGGWFRGKKDECPVAGFARHGYVIAAIDYRLTRDGVFPAQIRDCRAAVSWLREHAATLGIDPERIGAWGSSAGGHLVALMGTASDDPWYDGPDADQRASSHVSCVCAFFPATDLVTLAAGADPRYWRIRHAIPWLLGASVARRPEAARAASPALIAGPSSAPFLIFHGTDDGMIPLEQSRELDHALTRVGVESRLVVLEGAGHTDLIYARPEVEAAVLEFFDRHLRPASAPSLATASP